MSHVSELTSKLSLSERASMHRCHTDLQMIARLSTRRRNTFVLRIRSCIQVGPTHLFTIRNYSCENIERLIHSRSESLVRSLHILREYLGAISVFLIPSNSVMSILPEVSVSLVVTHSFSDRFNILRQRTN